VQDLGAVRGTTSTIIEAGSIFQDAELRVSQNIRRLLGIYTTSSGGGQDLFMMDRIYVGKAWAEFGPAGGVNL